jgi:hypothetical protein
MRNDRYMSQRGGTLVISALPETTWPEPFALVESGEQLDAAPEGSCIFIRFAGFWRKENGHWVGTVSRSQHDRNRLANYTEEGDIAVSPIIPLGQASPDGEAVERLDREFRQRRRAS